MKNRWFNYRPLCFVFAFLLLGSLFAFYIVDYVTLTLIISALVFITLFVVAILKRKIKYLLVPLISFFVGVGLYNLAIQNFNREDYLQPKIIEARLYRVEKATEDYTRVYADSVVFDGNGAKTHLLIYIYDDNGIYSNIEIGSIISFKPINFYKTDLNYSDLPNAKYYEENLRYTVSANMQDVTYVKTDKTFAEKIKAKIKENLSLGLSEENVEYSYASLFGDKDAIETDMYRNFKLSGIAHLLAVSGLHVGIIAAVLSLILKAFKAKPKVKFFVISIFLVAYAYLCNFSVSVIRATIMTMFALLAPLVYREYDSLSALSFAGIILFLINPLIVFDVSFLLSFSCVFGMIMLLKPLESAFAKIKFNKRFSSALALSLASTISLVLIFAYFFNNLNIVSILANVILVPLFTIAFVIIFVLSFVSLIIPFVTYLLYPINYLLNFISLFANFLGNLPISNFATISIPFMSLFLYCILIFVLSRFFTAKKRYKIILSVLIVAILIVTLV